MIKNKQAKDASTKELLENLGHLKITDLTKEQTFQFISVQESLGAKTISKIALVISIILPLLLFHLSK
jgi:hypothetical protein